MGTFGKSFAREIGKNTGKWASNKVFGNTGHATPHRIVRESGGSSSMSNANIEKDKLELEKKRLRAEESRKDEEELTKARNSVDEKIEQVETIKFPKNEEEITDKLNQLKLRLKSGKWSDGNEKDKAFNPLMDAYLAKFEEGIDILSSVNDSSVYLKKYHNDLKEFKKKKFKQKKGTGIIFMILLIVGSIVSLLIIGAILSMIF